MEKSLWRWLSTACEMGQTPSSKTADEIPDEKMLAWQDNEVCDYIDR